MSSRTQFVTPCSYFSSISIERAINVTFWHEWRSNIAQKEGRAFSHSRLKSYAQRKTLFPYQARHVSKDAFLTFRSRFSFRGGRIPCQFPSLQTFDLSRSEQTLRSASLGNPLLIVGALSSGGRDKVDDDNSISGVVISGGTFIEYRVGNDRRVGVVQRKDGKRNWIVIDSRGITASINPRQITFVVNPSEFSRTSGGELQSFLDQVENAKDGSSLEIAWEFLLEEGSKQIDVTTLSELIFSKSTGVHRFAVHQMLTQDKIYFKPKSAQCYEPRSASVVEDLKSAASAEAARQQEHENFFGRLRSSLQDSNKTSSKRALQDGDRTRLECVETYAVHGDDAGADKQRAVEILQALGRSTLPHAALQLLVDLGVWNPHENVVLRKRKVQTTFSERLVEVAEQISEETAPDAARDRLDLRHLKVYTIDDESTTEIDDGLSVEYLPDGRPRLWVHIADAARWVQPNDELELEARRRSKTLYLPTGPVHMFPHSVAAGHMSLVQGRDSCALSYCIELDDDGGVQEYTIHHTVIRPTYRITYEDADEMLGHEEEPEMQILFEWAGKRAAWRVQQGAIQLNMPEPIVKVNAGGEVVIEPLAESASRSMVAELMILCGEVTAKYGIEHKLVLPFRTQQQPQLPPEDELAGLVGPVRSCAIRRCMPKSSIRTTAGRHASLGLDAYVQATSPIRRYSDLLVHFQLKAHLDGARLPYSEDQMKQLIVAQHQVAAEASTIERMTNRYWVLEYLRRHATTATYSGLILRWLREDQALGLVLLEDLGVELSMRLTRQVTVGDRVLVRVAQSDPRADTIILNDVSLSVTSPSASVTPGHSEYFQITASA